MKLSFVIEKQAMPGVKPIIPVKFKQFDVGDIGVVGEIKLASAKLKAKTGGKK